MAGVLRVGGVVGVVEKADASRPVGLIRPADPSR